jgi:maleylpyruvate isomerase
VSDISADLTLLRASTSDLVAGLAAERWSDRDVAVPSLLPGWTRGHVLTHIARNADSIARTLSGALIGEIVARYPGGQAGRAADIEAGADRHMAELLADVTESAEKLDRVLGAVHDADGWNLVTEKERPAWHWLHARLDEVEIHRVDLAGSYTADRWPPALVVRNLPRLVETLDARTDDALHIVVEAEGSLAPDHVGTDWTVGTGTPVEVRGPDWAVLAWLIGRPVATLGRLSATPELRPWA